MLIGDRIKELRLKLGLNQTDFGNEIGLKQSSIGLYENGDRKVSDQSLLLICNRFNANIEWLKTGCGKMFDEMSDEEELSLYVGRLVGSENEFKKKAILELCKLPDEVWETLKKAALDTISKN